MGRGFLGITMVYHIPQLTPGLTFSGFQEFIRGVLVDSAEISEGHVRQLFDYFDRVSGEEQLDIHAFS